MDTGLYTLNVDQVDTPLGSVVLEVISSHSALERTPDHVIQTLAHRIRWEGFDLEQHPWGKPVDRIRAWTCYIEQTGTQPEQLILRCRLLDLALVQMTEYSTGEYLDAKVFEGSTAILHIGSEDEDVLNPRYGWGGPHAMSTDPVFGDIPDGLERRVPEMSVGHEIYFHFILAYNAPWILGGDELATWDAVWRIKDRPEHWAREPDQQAGSTP